MSATKPDDKLNVVRSGPNYWLVFLTFARNSLVRNLLFRTNFVIETISSVSWAMMNVGFYWLIFQHAPSIGLNTGWEKYEFLFFLVRPAHQLDGADFLYAHAEEFSELIRTGGLDFALLKPIDTQFLISFRKMDWSSLVNVGVACVLLGISLSHLSQRQTHPWHIEPIVWLLYPFYILCGVLILYSLMTCLAATSIWLGRNQTLYDFWFYITNFSRYPMEIYQQGWGMPLWFGFTFIIPVLVVVNIPARLLAQPLTPRDWWEWPLAGFPFWLR